MNEFRCASLSEVALVVENLSVNAGDIRDIGSIPVVMKILWKRARQPTPVFLPGESPHIEEPDRLWSRW